MCVDGFGCVWVAADGGVCGMSVGVGVCVDGCRSALVWNVCEGGCWGVGLCGWLWVRVGVECM